MVLQHPPKNQENRVPYRNFARVLPSVIRYTSTINQEPSSIAQNYSCGDSVYFITDSLVCQALIVILPLKQERPFPVASNVSLLFRYLFPAIIVI